ncbi:MAG TPA: RagB/SusD family nutrient uptake outer membrane protein [Bacteroidales bacterium]|nr:RagB/SusD family nutrient uptake outer membrane protein [Bacteroidales bacterium]
MKRIILLLSVLFVMNGCQKFLDEEMQGIYTSATFYKTDNHAMLALTAAYQPMAFTSIQNSLWVFGDVASDDAIKGGNPGDQSEIEFIDQFTYTRDNGFLLNIWRRYYEGISRANDVIHRLGPDITPALRERVIAEAKFLRAYYYFHLVNIFGEIPLKTTPAYTADDLHVPVSPVSKIYDQIETDLKEAANALPPPFTVEDGRATKAAALGLLAKVYLFREKYTECLDAIVQLEQSGNFDLLPVYRNNFEVEHQGNVETVFAIQHLTGQTPFMGNVLNQWFAPQIENGYFFNTPTQDFVDAFEVTQEGVPDPRLDYTLAREGSVWLNGEPYNPAWSPTGFTQKKHLQPLSEIPKGIKGNGSLNYVFMRYAEVLLMTAEALNELGRSDEALEPLNRIRKRARESYIHDTDLPGYGSIPENLLPEITTTNQSQLREIIRNERRVELGFEFHRFYDLMRYGREYAQHRLGAMGFNYDQHRYFPIPQNEADINRNIN